MEKHSLIDRIKNADADKELRKIYTKYREEFLAWSINTHKCTEDEAIEVFQQTMIVFYENIIIGKLKVFTSKVKTYIFSIGKHKILELRREQKKNDSYDSDYQFDERDIYINEFDDEYEKKMMGVENSLIQLGEPCRRILELFYYHQKTMDQISELMEYKNKQTVRNLKYKCLIRLRQIFKGELDSLN